MELPIVELGLRSAPRVVYDDDSADLRCLDDCLGFTAVLEALRCPIRKKKIGRSGVVVVKRLDECESPPDRSEPIFGCSPAKEFFPNRSGQQNSREQEIQLGQQVEVIESDDGRSVNRANRRALHDLD
jgi:hypothetical protein